MESLAQWLTEEAFVVTTSTGRYVPDWNAIGAIGNIVVAGLAAVGVGVSLVTIIRQLRHQSELEAKRVEQAAVMDLLAHIDGPVNACLDLVGASEMRRVSGGGNESTILTANAQVSLSLRRLSYTMATVRNVVGLGRDARRPANVIDAAFRQFESALDACLLENTKMVAYIVDRSFVITVAEYNLKSLPALEANRVLRGTAGALIGSMYGPRRNEWAEFGRILFTPAMPIMDGVPADLQRHMG